MTKECLEAKRPKYYIYPGLIKSEIILRSLVIDPDRIIRVSCKEFHRAPKDIISKNRLAMNVRPRQAVMYLLFKYSGLNKSEIGRFLKRDHTTIIYGIQQVEHYYFTGDNPKLIEKIELIKEILAAGC